MKVPAPWLIGATQRCRSPASKPKPSSMVRMSVVRHRKLCFTAFGVPEVPPVNLMPLTSSGETSGQSGEHPANSERSMRAVHSAPSKGLPAIFGCSQVAKRCAVFASVKMMSGSTRVTWAPDVRRGASGVDGNDNTRRRHGSPARLPRDRAYCCHKQQRADAACRFWPEALPPSHRLPRSGGHSPRSPDRRPRQQPPALARFGRGRNQWENVAQPSPGFVRSTTLPKCLSAFM